MNFRERSQKNKTSSAVRSGFNSFGLNYGHNFFVSWVKIYSKLNQKFKIII